MNAGQKNFTTSLSTSSSSPTASSHLPLRPQFSFPGTKPKEMIPPPPACAPPPRPKLPPVPRTATNTGKECIDETDESTRTDEDTAVVADESNDHLEIDDITLVEKSDGEEDNDGRSSLELPAEEEEEPGIVRYLQEDEDDDDDEEEEEEEEEMEKNEEEGEAGEDNDEEREYSYVHSVSRERLAEASPSPNATLEKQSRPSTSCSIPDYENVTEDMLCGEQEEDEESSHKPQGYMNVQRYDPQQSASNEEKSHSRPTSGYYNMAPLPPPARLKPTSSPEPPPSMPIPPTRKPKNKVPPPPPPNYKQILQELQGDAGSPVTTKTSPVAPHKPIVKKQSSTPQPDSSQSSTAVAPMKPPRVRGKSSAPAVEDTKTSDSAASASPPVSRRQESTEMVSHRPPVKLTPSRRAPSIPKQASPRQKHTSAQQNKQQQQQQVPKKPQALTRTKVPSKDLAVAKEKSPTSSPLARQRAPVRSAPPPPKGSPSPRPVRKATSKEEVDGGHRQPSPALATRKISSEAGKTDSVVSEKAAVALEAMKNKAESIKSRLDGGHILPLSGPERDALISMSSAHGSGSGSGSGFSKAVIAKMDLLNVELNRTEGQTLGLHIAEGYAMTNRGNQVRGVFVKEIIPGTPSHACQSLNVQDMLIEIDGACVVGVTLEDAAKLLKGAGAVVRLKVGRTSTNQSSENQEELTPEPTQEVKKTSLQPSTSSSSIAAISTMSDDGALKEENKKLSEEVSNLKKELSESQDTITDYTQTVATLSVEKTKLEREIHKLRDQVSANAAKSSSTEELDTIRAQLKEVQNEKDSLQQELKEARTEISNLKRELSSSAQQIDGLTKERDNISSRVSALENDVKEEKKLRVTAEEKLATSLRKHEQEIKDKEELIEKLSSMASASTETDSPPEEKSKDQSTATVVTVDKVEEAAEKKVEVADDGEDDQDAVSKAGKDGDKPREKSPTPTARESTPVEKESTPVEKESTSTEKPSTPVEKEPSSVEEEPAPVITVKEEDDEAQRQFNKVKSASRLDSSSAVYKSQLTAQMKRKKPTREHVRSMASISPFPEEMTKLQITEEEEEGKTAGANPRVESPSHKKTPLKPPQPKPKPRPQPVPRKRQSPEHGVTSPASTPTGDPSKRPMPVPRSHAEPIDDVDGKASPAPAKSSPHNSPSGSPAHLPRKAKLAEKNTPERRPTAESKPIPPTKPSKGEPSEDKEPRRFSDTPPKRPPKPVAPKPSPRPQKPTADTGNAQEKDQSPPSVADKLEEIKKKDPSELTIKERMMLAQQAMAVQAEYKQKGMPPPVRRRKPMPKAVSVDEGEIQKPEPDKEGDLERSQSMEDLVEGETTPRKQPRKLPPGAFNMALPGIGGPEMRRRSNTVASTSSAEGDHADVDRLRRDETPPRNLPPKPVKLESPLRQPETIVEDSPSNSNPSPDEDEHTAMTPSNLSTPELNRKEASPSGSCENILESFRDIAADIDESDPAASLENRGNSPATKALPDPEQVLYWSPEVVGLWLGTLGLNQYSNSFREKAVKGWMMFDLDNAKLKKMGMNSSNDRNIFKKELKLLKPFADKIKREYEQKKKAEKKQAKKKK